MLKRLLIVGLVAAGMGWTAAQAGLVEAEPYVEIWTDREMGGVYEAGECMEIFIRPAYDCYVIVYEIDTDGYLRLLFPYDCRDEAYVRGGQVYRLGRGGYGRYYITGPSGVEYIHVLASFRPFRPLYWHGCDGYDAYAYDVTWRGFGDYWGCALPPRIYGDPFIAMQSINEFICYDALDAGLAFAGFTYFYVDERVSYPRYLCYDCHGFHPVFRPYVSVCTGFHISFVACDPCYSPCSWWWWCTPARVYCGPRYVCYPAKPCGTYPSCYKWKSRCESYCDAGGSRTSYGEYYTERLRPDGQSDGAVRVKSESAGEQRGLYSGRQSASVPKTREPSGREPSRVEVKQVPVQVEKTKSASESRALESREKPAEPSDAPKVEKRKSQEASGEPQVARMSRPAESKSDEKASEDSKAAKATRSAGDAKKSVKKESSARSSTRVTPKVRTQTKGTSPSQRRRVSR